MTAQAADVLGTVRSYSDLHQIMRARADALEITRDALDELAGLQTGYSGKVLAPRPMKRIMKREADMVLAVMLPVLGMKLVAVVDEQALERFKSRRVKRKLPSILPTTLHISFSRKELKKRQRNGAKKRWVGKTKEQRAAHMRMMARKRWDKAGAALSFGA